MPKPNDRNSQIALGRGWTWSEALYFPDIPRTLHPSLQSFVPLSLWEEYVGTKAAIHWRDPEGRPAFCPDFVGTEAQRLVDELGDAAQVLLEKMDNIGWDAFEPGLLEAREILRKAVTRYQELDNSDRMC